MSMRLVTVDTTRHARSAPSEVDHAREDRDQRRGERPRRDQLEQQIGDAERGEEGVELTRVGDRAFAMTTSRNQPSSRDTRKAAGDDQAGPRQRGGRGHAEPVRRARGWASRYAAAKRPGDTCVYTWVVARFS